MNGQRDANFFPGFFMLVGFAVLVAGVWWIYRPAALIVAGLMLAAFGFIGRRGSL